MSRWKTATKNCLHCASPYVRTHPANKFCSFQCRFLSVFEEIKPDANGCMNWPLSKREHGYGQFSIAPGKIKKAHRISWIVRHGDIAENLGVLHKCDNPACVNPDHLFLGDQLANVKDMISKGRAQDYEKWIRVADRHPNGKLKARNVALPSHL